MRSITRYLQSFLHIFFPNICVGCGSVLSRTEKVVCIVCELKLPRTHFCNYKNNPVEKSFWGRIPVQSATSLLFYERALVTQHLLKLLKYHGRQDIGTLLGNLLAKELLANKNYDNIDYIVPVPLHPKKLKQRGYNQCDSIAKALSETLNKPIASNQLIRIGNNKTQTNKNRSNRWENVKNVFQLKDVLFFKNMHVILVDDVLTTGATIESCASKILQSEGSKVSVVTLAYAL